MGCSGHSSAHAPALETGFPAAIRGGVGSVALAEGYWWTMMAQADRQRRAAAVVAALVLAMVAGAQQREVAADEALVTDGRVHAIGLPPGSGPVTVAVAP